MRFEFLEERDFGEDNRSSVGPGQVVMHPDGRRLFVSQFNRNSISTYDLTLGPYGTLVRETPLVGENPYSLALSPDGRFLAIVRFDRSASAWKPAKVFHLETPSPYAPAETAA